MSHELSLPLGVTVGRLKMLISFSLMENLPRTQTQKVISTKKPEEQHQVSVDLPGSYIFF